MGIKKKDGEGAKASEHARAQRRRREEEKQRKKAKRISGRTHHDGKVTDHKRLNW